MFKNGWRQAYPALSLEKPDALIFQVSWLDSDFLGAGGELFARHRFGGMKIEATVRAPLRLPRAFPTPSGFTTALFEERVQPPGAPLRFVPSGWKSRSALAA